MRICFTVFRLLSLVLIGHVGAAPAYPAPSKISYWDSPRRGANFFNDVESPDRFQAAKAFGIELVRLAPNKWLNGRKIDCAGDFLIGPIHGFKVIDPKDVKLLTEVLDDAQNAKVKIVVTMLSLPGSRWGQHNKNVEERTIWEDFRAQEQAIEFWRQLARVLKDHPAVVGYNIRNEPSPELVKPKFPDWYTGDYVAWYKKVKDNPADLNLFYRKVVKAIREVDSQTPVVLDSGFYATPWAFKILEPIDDDKVIYSFHMYEPYAFTTFKNKGVRYPGKAAIGDADEPPVLNWDKQALERLLTPIDEWQRKYRIPSNRIYAAEFGVYRSNDGAEAYLRDLTEIFNEKKWHWAFYSFREDSWEGMNYEFGPERSSKKINPNPLSDVLKGALKAKGGK
jgi:endoglucanase